MKATRSRARQGPLRVAALLAIALSLTGCPEDDVGVPCRMEGLDDGIPPNGVLLAPLADDCISRICLGIAEPDQILSGRGTCTRSCRSGDDCPDRTETCPEGFSCLPVTATGPLRCCQLCLCNRHLGVDTAVYCEGRQPNPACPSP